MSNIEKIRQEIKRRKKILEESNYYLDNSQQALGYSFALDDFKDFIDSLPEDEPSKDLEEAAEEYGDYHNDDCFDATGDRCPHIRKAFIAGAEWGAKHLK